MEVGFTHYPVVYIAFSEIKPYFLGVDSSRPAEKRRDQGEHQFLQ